jgi:hypothetical protein
MLERVLVAFVLVVLYSAFVGSWIGGRRGH